MTITTLPHVISAAITARLDTRRARRAFSAVQAQSAQVMRGLYGNTVAARRSVLLEQVAYLEDRLADVFPAAYGPAGLEEVGRAGAALLRLYAATERAVDQAAFVAAGDLQAGDVVWSVRDYAPLPVTAVEPGLDGGVWVTTRPFTPGFVTPADPPFIYALEDLLPTKPVHIDVHAMALTCGASHVEAGLWWDLGATADRAERARLLKLIAGLAAIRVGDEAVEPLLLLAETETSGPLSRGWMPPRVCVVLLFAALAGFCVPGVGWARYVLLAVAIGAWCGSYWALLREARRDVLVDDIRVTTDMDQVKAKIYAAMRARGGSA